VQVESQAGGMDGYNRLTTEVTIKNNCSYTPYLKRVIACIGNAIGMPDKGVDETARALSDVCRALCDCSPDGVGLSIAFKPYESHLAVEVSDPLLKINPFIQGSGTADNSLFKQLEECVSLTDGIEVVGGDNGTTIRITKHVNASASTRLGLHFGAWNPGTLKA
jgi:hypothetical protein